MKLAQSIVNYVYLARNSLVNEIEIYWAYYQNMIRINEIARLNSASLTAGINCYSGIATIFE